MKIRYYKRSLELTTNYIFMKILSFVIYFIFFSCLVAVSACLYFRQFNLIEKLILIYLMAICISGLVLNHMTNKAT